MILTITCLLMIGVIAALLYDRNVNIKALNEQKEFFKLLSKSSFASCGIIEHETYFEVSITKRLRAMFSFKTKDVFITIKYFPKLDDPDFARLQAEELLEKLIER